VTMHHYTPNRHKEKTGASSEGGDFILITSRRKKKNSRGVKNERNAPEGTSVNIEASGSPNGGESTRDERE